MACQGRTVGPERRCYGRFGGQRPSSRPAIPDLRAPDRALTRSLAPVRECSAAPIPPSAQSAPAVVRPTLSHPWLRHLVCPRGRGLRPRPPHPAPAGAARGFSNASENQGERGSSGRTGPPRVRRRTAPSGERATWRTERCSGTAGDVARIKVGPSYPASDPRERSRRSERAQHDPSGSITGCHNRRNLARGLTAGSQSARGSPVPKPCRGGSRRWWPGTWRRP